ncbi:MAG: DMT family transporter [Planctomycetota bacterium]
MAERKMPGSQKNHAAPLGIFFLILAAVLWSLNGALINLVYEDGHGPHGVTIAFYRSLFAGLFLWPLAHGKFKTLRGVGPDETSPRGIRPAVFCCVLAFVSMTTCFVVANTMTEAANAIILQYTSTFWVFGLATLITGETPSRGELPVLALAGVGVSIIFLGGLWAGDRTNLAGLGIALGAGLFYGLLTLLLRRVRECDAAAITVVNNLGSAILLFPIVLVVGDVWLSTRAWWILMLMGAVQLGLPYYFFSLGLARVPAHQAALITMLEPILVPIWAYLAVKQPVPPQTVIGGGVILAALLLFIASKRKRSVLKE